MRDKTPCFQNHRGNLANEGTKRTALLQRVDTSVIIILVQL